MPSVIYFPAIGWGPSGTQPVQTAGDGYTLYERPDGGSFVYLSRWSAAVERVLTESRVPRVLITEHWTAPSLEALRPYVDHVEELVLQSAAISDVSLLADMPALRTLELHRSTNGVPFSNLTKLEKCTITAPARMGEVCRTPALRELTLGDLPFKDLRPLERLQSLTSLTLYGKHRASLSGIEALPLSHLSLQLRRLESLAPVVGLPLRRLRIDDGRALQDMDKVGRIASLESLTIEDTSALRSLEFVAALPALQQLDIAGTVLTDEVVSVRVLAGLRALRELRLSGEKHGLRNLAGLEALGALSGLETFHVHKGPEEIATIAWVRGLTHLKHFWLGKTRIRDGDVSPLLDLPCIERVALLPTYSDYSHTDETFGAAMRQRLALHTREAGAPEA